MSGNYPFVVHYRLHGQAHSVEVDASSEALTPSQARSHVESLHTSAKSSDITDIRVTAGQHGGPTQPGHQQASNS
ncbi:hypothetical protein [Pseudomonas sp. GV071]|jgi:hypothetical protein|uniref:hypothetical protein n=1 Tax=Pseudomonas sp. GV071 TaxID=2135754 RepID=UPI000D3B0CD0|nr:hypothetical protein [Pseudomonas sp. GV071]PTQ74089.1 hypothetical protein C8K61_101529 [Pseudomonas sp. GV071]